MTASDAPLLDVDALEVAFEQYDRGLRRRLVRPVSGISVRVDSGELVALVGASGAGKSLVAHAVLGMLPPNAVEGGEVRWRGAPVTLADRQALGGHGIALLPQSLAHLDPTATVGAQVRRAGQLAGLGRRAAAVRAREALAARGLPESVLRAYPHELSGGMGRRVLTTMALFAAPELLVADEPTPGLEAAGVTAVFAELRAIADSGRGVLLITHELDAVVEVADRVVVCAGGRSVDEVDAADFRGDGGRLRHPYTRALWQALPHNGLRVRGWTPPALDVLEAGPAEESAC